MSNYDNTNTGSLFKADKGDNEKRPDYRGSVNVDGVEYWLSAWIRTAGDNSKRAGEKFMSLKLEAKEQQSAPPPKPQAAVDQDIPF